MEKFQQMDFFKIGSLITTGTMGLFALLLSYFSFRERLARKKYMSEAPLVLSHERNKAKKYLESIDIKVFILTIFVFACFLIGIIFQIIGY